MAVSKKEFFKINPFFTELPALFRITPGKISVYIFAFIAIEFQSIWLEPKLSTLYYGIILFFLLHHYIFSTSDPNRTKLLLLAIVPLLRIISLGMPVGLVDPLYRYPMVGMPIFLATGLILKESNIPWSSFALQWPRIRKRDDIWENILIALSGIPLGLMGYYFADPIPLVTQFNWPQVIASILGVFIYIALLEEIIFRGIILHTLQSTYGQVGIVISTVVYTVLFTSYHSIEGIVLMGLASLLYSWHVLESRSILAATISHTLMVVGMLIVWPIIF